MRNVRLADLFSKIRPFVTLVHIALVLVRPRKPETGRKAACRTYVPSRIATNLSPDPTA
jgi:hypothetical protein